eukprot:15154656-Heterocapsa_arctica.AAC.1
MRTQAKGASDPHWFIFDGCHRALAYAQAELAGKKSDSALLDAIFICGSGRHDLQATIYDTRPGRQPCESQPYEAIMCGRGN